MARNGQPRPEPVLQADVQQLDAHVEDDEEAAYEDLDHFDVSDEEPDPTPSDPPVRDPAFDDVIDDV